MAHPVSRFSLAVILSALLHPSLTEAITIENHVDTPETFLTTVTDSVGFFSWTHHLVDIPGTPWVNSSEIVETTGPAGGADSLSVTWTSQHIKGPHPEDRDPNGSVTLNLVFTPIAAGEFKSTGRGDPTLTAMAEIPHRLSHFDRFGLFLDVDVSSTLLGGLDITRYTIQYFARHCEVPLPDLSCTPLDGFPPEDLLLVSTDGGVEAVPEPDTLVLCILGWFGALFARYRGWTRTGSPVRSV